MENDYPHNNNCRLLPDRNTQDRFDSRDRQSPIVRLGVGLESVASAGDSNQLSVVEQSIQDGAGRQVHRLAAYLLLGLPKLLERVERSGFVEGPESRHV